VDADRLAAAAGRLPLFPLPRVVLLPGAVLPLHVFEPRYRALIEHCLASDRLLGVATLQPGYEADYYGRPPIWPEVGIGEIIQHQAFADGRSNVVLQYVGRMAVDSEEASELPFRVVSGTLLPPREATGSGAERLRILLLQLGSANPNARDEVGRLAALEGVDLVDALARKLLDEPEERRAYLGCPTLAAQVELVENRLADLLTMGDPSAQA
jgi:Lon protease-like protein